MDDGYAEGEGLNALIEAAYRGRVSRRTFVEAPLAAGFTAVAARELAEHAALALTHHPSDGLVGGLQSLGFPPPCHPSYGALALASAGLTPAEHVSFLWTHD